MLNSNNQQVQEKAASTTIYHVIDDQWDRLRKDKKKELLKALAKTFQNQDKFIRANAAKKMIEILLPYIRRTQNREELISAISNCISFESSREVITSERQREVATGAGVVLPVPMLFFAIFGNFDDYEYERIDVDKLPRFDDQDLNAFQSIIDLVLDS